MDGVRVADGTEFDRRTGPFRRELLAHCYRMLGSIHDAEDLLQETYLRAWRAYDGFEGRSSVRTWLYRIATNACLTALARRGSRPLPSGLGAPADDPSAHTGPARTEIPWLQPIPDALVTPGRDDPALIAESRATLRLAFVAALQLLPPRQRAVLILRDVLAWRASEVAELLGMTTAGVKSALARARGRIAEVSPAEDRLAEPSEPERRELLDRFVTAFEGADIAALTRILRDDVVFEMPPTPMWFRGRDIVTRFLGSRVLGAAGSWRLVPVEANGQPAVAMYLREDDGAHHAHAIQVLTLAGDRIARVTSFLDADLFVPFGLPVTHGT